MPPTAACRASSVEVWARKAANCKLNRNAARDMLRRCLRKSQWPEIYEAEIRVWDEKLNVTKYAKVAFMLPHEILNSLFKKNPKFNFEDLTAAAESVRQHCRDVTEGYGQTMIPMALWCDGTPYSWDRTSSLEVIMMSLPGLGPPNSTPKNCIAKGETFEDIWEIMAYSCRCLFLGKMPTLGHDGSQLKAGRAKVAGHTIPHRCVLAEVRADWKCLSEVFGLPNWKSTGGICARCSATPESFRDFSSEAAWRRERYDHDAFVQRQLADGKKLSGIFSCPHFVTTCFKIDWLHVMDLGCSQDALGNLFWHILPQLGPNQSAQVG